MKKSVCFVLPRLKIASNGSLVGGAQNSALGLLKEVREAGFTTSIIAGVPSDTRETVRRGVLDEYADRFYFIDLPRIDPLSYGMAFTVRMSALMLRRRRALREVKAFHIHSGYYHYGICALPIERILGKPVLFSIYCPLPSKTDDTKIRLLKTAITRLAFAGVETLVATSANIARSLEEYGVQQPKIRTILPLPSLAKFYKLQEKQDRSKAAESCILFIGNDTKSKGLDVLLKAMAGMKDIANWKLDLLIENEDRVQSKNAKRTKSLISSLGIEDRIARHGIVPDIGEFYQRADIVVIPYRDTDGPSDHPLVLIEAMAAGRCVVASRVGGIPGVVEDGVSGVLVPPSDHAFLGKEIRSILDNPTRREEMGGKARMRVRQLFDKEKIVASYVDLVEETIQRKERSAVDLQYNK